VGTELGLSPWWKIKNYFSGQYNGGIQVTGNWKELHNEQFHNDHCSNIVTVMNSTKIMQMGHVACMIADEKYTQNCDGKHRR
jgi:hypothetical protein